MRNPPIPIPRLGVKMKLGTSNDPIVLETEKIILKYIKYFSDLRDWMEIQPIKYDKYTVIKNQSKQRNPDRWEE